jgi:tetratricopeptide (TPR) repeat protein
LFIRADSAASFKQNLANLCGAMVLNLPEREERELEVQVAAAIRWLREHTGWFLIVDNVDTPDAAQEVEQLLQRLDTGHVVVTSRLSQWGGAAEELSLDVISETAATEFLLERTQGKRKPAATDTEDAKLLASDLGRLPLALEQAGAFIAKHRGSIQEYRTRWKQQEQKVLEWHDQRSMKYPASVATTWQTSFDQLSADGRGLLNVLCWLAPDPIPLTMIQKLTTVGDESSIDVETGIADLAEYSLLKWTSKRFDSLEVHRLVQEITRYRLPEVDSTTWFQRVLRMANDFVPNDPPGHDVRSWPTIYRPGSNHIAKLIETADSLQIVEPTTRLMSLFAGYMFTSASFAVAEPLMERLVEIFEDAYGKNHRNVAFPLNNLAQLFMATGRLAEAETLMRRALMIDEETYGTDDINIARDLNNLAQLLTTTNQLVEAEQLTARLVTIFEKSHGNNYPKLVIVLGNQAKLLVATNRKAKAESVLRRAIDIAEISYGQMHPIYANCLSILASLLKDTKRYSESEPLFRRVLAIDENSYGLDHPDVARDLNNLAQLLETKAEVAKNEDAWDSRASLLSEAERLRARCASILIAFGRSTGNEHPNLRAMLTNYKKLLQAMGLSESEALSKIQSALQGKTE